MSDSTNEPTTITVATNNGDVLVRRMTLADYAHLLRALDKMPQRIGEIIGTDTDFKSMDNAQMMRMIPGILADSWTDIAAIIAVPTDKDADFMLELDAADALDVVDAILEQNDIARIVVAVKKILARRAKILPVAK